MNRYAIAMMLIYAFACGLASLGVSMLWGFPAQLILLPFVILGGVLLGHISRG